LAVRKAASVPGTSSWSTSAYAEVDHELVPGTDAALRTAKRRRDQHPAAGADDPDLDVVANYTAFQALRGTVAPVSGHQ